MNQTSGISFASLSAAVGVTSIPTTQKNVFYVLKHDLSPQQGSHYFAGTDTLNTYASPSHDPLKARRFRTIPELLHAFRDAKEYVFNCQIVRVTETTTTVPGKETRTLISEKEVREIPLNANVKWTVAYNGLTSRDLVFCEGAHRSVDSADLFDTAAAASQDITRLVKKYNFESGHNLRIVPVLIETTKATTKTDVEVTVLG